jgi:hypothetical protein
MRQYPEEVSYLRQLIDSGRCELSGGLYVQPDEKITSINGGITISNQALRLAFDSHGNIVSLIDKDNDEREIIGAGRYGNQLICQVDNGDEYEYCLGPVLGTTEDYPCTIKRYKGPVMTRLIAESKFTESNYISREVKLYSKAGPDIECPDACEKGKHTFEYSLYPHSGSWRKAFTYRRGWELNNPLT